MINKPSNFNSVFRAQVGLIVGLMLLGILITFFSTLISSYKSSENLIESKSEKIQQEISQKRDDLVQLSKMINDIRPFMYVFQKMIPFLFYPPYRP